MDERKSAAAKEIVQRLLKMPADQRRKEARALFGDDAELRAAVLSLWKQTMGATIPPPMDSPAPPRAGPPAHADAPAITGYEIVGRLGEGAMGVVWEAVQISTRRHVALKLLSEASLGSERRRKRFAREVELAASLEHPNIAHVYDSGLDKGVYYYSMELIKGVPLDEFVQQRKLNPDQILMLLRKVCDAMQHAHDRGVIHRDLKPSNILVDKRGEAHVLDFGLAKLLDSQDAMAISIDGNVTGTPMYMSPEQAAGNLEVIDARTDVYTLGVIAYRLLTGTGPHDLSGSYLQVLRRVAEEDVRRPSLLAATVNADIEAILLKALAHEPADRYATAEELGQDVLRYLNGYPVMARPANFLYVARKRLRRHRQAALITLLVVGLAAMNAYLRISAQPTATPQAPAAAKQVALAAEKPAIALPASSAGSAQPSTQPPSDSIALASEGIDLDKGLMLHFSFKSPAKDGAITDESGNGNDGRVVGAVWNFDPGGRGWYSFNAEHQTDAIIVPNSPALNPQHVTECAWIKANNRDQSWNRVIDKDWINGYDLELGTQSACVSVGDGALDGHFVYSNQSVADGQWHHVAATYDGADEKIYVDGKLQDRPIHWAGMVNANPSDLRIGNGINAFPNDKKPDQNLAFDGAIRQVRIYNRALSPAEIKALMNADAPAASVEPRAATDEPHTVTNSLGMTFASIPAGKFMMGSPDTEENRYDGESQHLVTLTSGFYMATTPVTQKQWQAVMDNNPSHFQGDDLPVETVSWDNAMDFCARLSRRDGKRYRLPTEAEYEYACRAGTTTAFYTGDGDQALDQAGWYAGNSDQHTHPVGQKKPNPWGLYDMHGNVWQWCSDWYGNYPTEAVTDPRGPDDGHAHIVRGGAWYRDSRRCRSAVRGDAAPGFSNAGIIGVRVVLDLNAAAGQ